MAEEAALLPGTLDLLILKAVSLAPSTATASCSALNRSPAARCSSSRAHSTRRWRDSSTRDSSAASGARPTTIAARSSTN